MGQTWMRAALAASLAIVLAGQGAQAQDTSSRQAAKTERANREAVVADETGTLDGAPRPAPANTADAHKTPLAPSYGPVLDPRGRQGQDAARKDPAEVHDETDTLTRQAPPAGAQPGAQQPQPQPQPRKQQQPQARRHPAQQPAGPLAPRPLRPPSDGAAGTAAVQGLVPVPAPAPAPQPPSPSSSAVVGCQGSFCTDAAGNSYSGSGPAVIGNGGRLCTRGTSTVQCL